MKNLYLLIFTIFLFTGCLYKNNISKTNINTTPNWYLMPQQNNQTFIYGTGEGYTLNEAKNNALNDMSSRLMVSVKSTLNTKTSINFNGKYNKSILNDLTVENNKITFNNAKIEKSTKNGNIIYIMMKVNRNNLYKIKKKTFLFDDTQLDKKYSIIQQHSLLEKIYELERLKQTIQKAKIKANVLFAINSSFNYSNYVKKYNDYLEEENRLKSKVVISITTNNHNNFFKDILAEKLNKKLYKIQNTNSNISINMRHNIRYTIVRGWKIAKVTTNISILSKGKRLAGTIINTIGRSSSTNINALNNASKQFDKKLDQIGINNILFKKGNL